MAQQHVVRGGAAFVWGRVALIGWLIGVVAFTIAAGMLNSPSSGLSRAVFASVATLWAAEASAIGFTLVQQRREVRAGYTTLHAKFQHLDQIEPSSGKVIRPRGEAFLSRRDHRERRKKLLGA